VPLLQQHNSYSPHASISHSIPQTPLYQPQQTYTPYPAASTTPVAQHANHIATYNHYQNVSPAPRATPQPSTSHSAHANANAYNPPRQSEIYTLADPANAALPADIREQFHTDDYGKVLFFTTPPLDVNPIPEEKRALGHSLRYLADKARNREEDERKRKERAAQLEAEATARLKRFKADEEGKKQWIFDQKVQALHKWAENMDRGTDELYKKMHGEDWKEMRELDLCKLAVKQEEAFKKQKEHEAWEKEMKERRQVKVTGFKWI
jgi:chromatin structure-remodeling complex subunit RSC1/2